MGALQSVHRLRSGLGAPSAGLGGTWVQQGVERDDWTACSPASWGLLVVRATACAGRPGVWLEVTSFWNQQLVAHCLHQLPVDRAKQGSHHSPDTLCMAVEQGQEPLLGAPTLALPS